MPVEGQEITVRYHDEYYGETDDVDEAVVATAGFETGFADVNAMAENDDVTDSVDTPGYVELGDEYGKLNYGNEVIHVANVFGTPDPYAVNPSATPTNPDNTPAQQSASEQASEATPAIGVTRTSEQTSSTPLAKTADPISGLASLGTAAAVTGAAAVAYAAYRRSEE